MKICVMIPTYDRVNCLYNLTKKLKSLNPHTTIVVLDDGTKDRINTKYIDRLRKNKYNLGKKRWYETINKLWAMGLETKSDLYIMLPDDALPNDNFFKEALRIWKSIEDQKKIALHLANNDRIQNWTKFKRVIYNKDAYLTQTTEFSFLCKPQFIKYKIPAIPRKRWAKNQALGSGVGNLVNNFWIRKGKRIFGVRKSLIHANEACLESKMNYKERLKNPWIIK